MITFEKYKKISKILNNKLKNYSTDPYFLAIKFLYIIKEHETFTKKYDLDFYKRISFVSYIFRASYKLIILFFLSFFLLFKKKNKIKFRLQSKLKIIIISHYISNNKTTDYDFYFGNLKIKDVSILRLLHKPILQSSSYSGKNFDYTEILNYNIGFIIHIKIIFNLFLKSIYYFINNKKIFDDQISLEYLSISTFTNVIFYYYCSKLFKNNNFSKAICTYEGHPFERLFFLATETSLNNIEKTGYIHTPYSELQNSAYLNLNKKTNPTKLLTYGDFSFYINKFEFPIKTSILGSTRYLNKKINFIDFNKGINNNVLFLPDGIDSEIHHFLELAEVLSKNFSNINFIIRFHPVSKKKFLKKAKKLSKQFNNFFLSNNSIIDDSIKCKYSIYRCSSSIIQSIGYGCLPILYDLKGFVYPDPLFRIRSNILSFNNKSEAFEILKKINNDIYTKNNIEKIIKNINYLYYKIDSNNFFDK